MSELSPNLLMPFIQAAQAQKHVTHNEAIRVLDTLVQLAVIAFDTTTPPVSASDGETYALGSGCTGVWAGNDGALATWFDSGWVFATPQAGWIAGEIGTRLVRIHDGSDWGLAQAAVDMDNVPSFGINAVADTTNRLSVSAPATLLNHQGAGHQLKINKAGSSETATLLFQSNWSGRAEMGLAGDDAFSVKVSADGSSWDEVLRVSPGEGVVTTANMVGTVSETPAPGDAIIETGTGANGSYTKFADGTLICQKSAFATASGSTATWTLPAVFASTGFSVSATVNGATPCVATIAARTTSTVGVASFDMLGLNTAAPTVDLVAVGRWF